MKFTNLLAIIAIAAYLPSCGNSHEDHDADHHDHEHCEAEDHDHEHEHEGEEHDHEHEAGHGSEEIILKPEMAKRLGVETAVVAPTSFSEVINVTGKILPAPGDQAVAVAPTSGVLTLGRNLSPGNTVAAGSQIAIVKANSVTGGDPDLAARRAIEAAKRELDRVTPLYKEGIVSAKEYNAILAAYESALAGYSPGAASGSITAPIGGVITEVLASQGQYVEAGQPIARISKTANLTLRADVPERYYSSLSSIKSANFKSLSDGRVVSLADAGGRLMPGSTMATAENGYFPVFFSFSNNGRAVPGSAVEVFLLCNQRQGVIAVPVTALTEQQGEKYVYIKIDDEGYERRLVKTGANDGARVEILSGLNPGETVVTAGATVVRLAENSGKIPEGHSHNH